MAKETKIRAGPRRVTITEDQLQAIENVAYRIPYEMTPSTAKKLEAILKDIVASALRLTDDEQRAVVAQSRNKPFKARLVRKVEEHADVVVMAKSHSEARVHIERMNYDDVPWVRDWHSIETDDLMEVNDK